MFPHPTVMLVFSQGLYITPKVN